MLESVQHTPFDISVLKRQTAMRLKSWTSNSPQARRLLINGRRLPAVVGQTFPGEPRALCVGPDEWLLVFDASLGLDQRRDIDHQAAEQQLAVVELSGGFAALKLQGSACRDVLAKGCGLDFHPHTFRTDTCARTLLAQVFVTLDCRGPQEFDVYMGRSFLWHLHSWLVDASLEYHTMTE